MFQLYANDMMFFCSSHGEKKVVKQLAKVNFIELFQIQLDLFGKLNTLITERLLQYICVLFCL